jgi:kynureninase
MTRQDCAERDRSDRLAPLRQLFALDQVDRDGVIYLDGNSLGVLPKAAIDRTQHVLREEWGSGLIRSWNTAGWITLAQRIGDKIATLVGANAGELIVTDSTSINVFKALSAARLLTDRRRIVSERTNFPTDLYIADTFAPAHGMELVLVDDDDVAAHLDASTAMVLVTHVNYRTGRMHDMAALTRRVHAAGAVMIWDLAHSAGAVPVDLNGADADFAVGCGYKFLNGGPGAPAFIWAHARHLVRMDRDGWRQPLSGWLGHAAPFAFASAYEPAAGIQRFICGTPPVLSTAALECGIDSVLAAGKYGGVPAIREKSIALTNLFIELVENRMVDHGFALASPRDPQQRGSQVSLAHATDGYPIMQALIARGVIGDFRAPDILRFGFTPLYTRFVDVWDAVERLAGIMATGAWRDPEFAVRRAVT